MKRIIFLLVCWIILAPSIVWANSSEDENKKEEQLLDKIESEMDFENLDEFTYENMPEKKSFIELVDDVRGDFFEGKSLKSIGEYIKNLLFYEIEEIIPVLKQVALIGIGLTILNKSFLSKNNYIADVNFLMVYGVIMGILLKSFSVISNVVISGVDKIIEFMTITIPVYATSLVVSGNISSASSFYVLSFTLIYIVEWITKIFIIPGINILVLIEFLNQLFEEDKLSKLSKFLEKIICSTFKITLSAVVGINIIKTMISPVKDRIADSTLIKGVGILPGIEKIAGSGGELLLSCGMLIKNSVGVSVLVVLCGIVLIPFVKVAAYNLSYNFLIAFLQPVSSNKLIKGMNSVAKGCSLYLKLLSNVVLLFFITVAIVCTTTSFVH